MNGWAVEFLPTALSDLKQLSKVVSSQVIAKFHEHAKNFDNVRIVPLHREWEGYFKLRVGDWRVAYVINRTRRLLIVAAVDHRRKIYKRKPPRAFK